MDDLLLFKNNDGSFTSPKNGRTYKSLKAFRAHWFNKGTGGFSAINSRKARCQHCNKEVSLGNVKKHEISCYLNPVNLRLCPICNGPIKNYANTKGTCSRSCANTHFKSGPNNGNWSGENYVTICFHYHKKQCIVCGEEKIVAVHHNDHNHQNDNPENLIPLCPTHHQYVHSRYKNEVQVVIDKYVRDKQLAVG